jgi:multicomponent Na+:H+ antiporter subunit E
MRMTARITMLVALWLLAWGEASVANVVSGVAVAGLLLLTFPPSTRAREQVRVHPLGVARLAGYVFVQLLTSNVVMTRAVLRRRPATQSGVIAHRLRQPSEHVVTIMTSVIALSPGTMTVDVDPDSTTIYVHFLLLKDVDAARTALDRLERLASGAIGGPATAPQSHEPGVP